MHEMVADLANLARSMWAEPAFVPGNGNLALIEKREHGIQVAHLIPDQRVARIVQKLKHSELVGGGVGLADWQFFGICRNWDAAIWDVRTGERLRERLSGLPYVAPRGRQPLDTPGVHCVTRVNKSNWIAVGGTVSARATSRFSSSISV